MSPCVYHIRVCRDVDFHGADIKKGGFHNIPGATICCALCIKHGSCRFWTYSTDLKKCWLKSSSNGKEKQANRVSGAMPNSKDAACPTPPCMLHRQASCYATHVCVARVHACTYMCMYVSMYVHTCTRVIHAHVYVYGWMH